MTNLGKYPLLGVNVSAVDYEYAVRAVIDAARRGSPLGITALAVHGVMTGALDPRYLRKLNGIDLVLPDGQPVRWALRWIYGVKLSERVYGPTLTLKVVRAAAEEGLPVYFYGSEEHTVQLLIQKLQRTFPHLLVAGGEPSKFRKLSQSEKLAIIRRIQESKARIVFVGLGCPRQEAWVYEYRDHLQLPILAVGAAFSFHAGVLPQAPCWMQSAGLEWLYRLVQEPKRLWKRYVFLNPLYLALIFLETLGVLKVPVLLPDGTESEESYG